MKAVIDLGVQSALEELNTCMPATIEIYNPVTGMATVKPSIKKIQPDGSTTDLPLILNVPILFPRWNGGDSYMHIPLKPGDCVTLVFSQRSLDNWKTTGGASVDPKDERMHHLSDAYAYPGGYSKADPLVGANGNDLIISHGPGKFTMAANGDLGFANAIATLSMAHDGGLSMANAIAAFTASKDGDISVGNAAGAMTISKTGNFNIGRPGGDLFNAVIQILTYLSTEAPAGFGAPLVHAADYLALKTSLMAED